MPASVALGLWAVSPTALLLPFAVAVVAAGASADLAAGRLVHGGWGAIDGAMLAPFFALGLAPVLTRRLGRAGPLGAATFAVLAIWGVQRLVLHR